jgi:hypothetical protein
MTPEAAQIATISAPARTPRGRAPDTRNCWTTSSSDPGGTIRESAFCNTRATNSARVWTRMVAAEASTGKNESSAE